MVSRSMRVSSSWPSRPARPPPTEAQVAETLKPLLDRDLLIRDGAYYLALAELGDLPRLRRLFPGRKRPIGNSEVRWDYNRLPSSFEDLAPLAGLVGLQSLELDSTEVTDLRRWRALALPHRQF